MANVRLNTVLFPDETVLLRLRRPLPAVVFRVGAYSLPPLAIFVLVAVWPEALDHFNEWLDLLPGFWPLVALLVALVFWTTLPGYVLIGPFVFDHWRVAITDQRVLVRHGWRNIRRGEMMRHEIENCLYDRTGGKIVLTGAGRELAIACSHRQAGRILEALGRDEAAS